MLLHGAGLRVLREAEAIPMRPSRIVEGGEAQVVFVDAQHGPDLIRAVRAPHPNMAGVHVVACVDPRSPHGCAMRWTQGRTTSCASRSSRDVLILRVAATGLRTHARLRANDAMLRSLIDSIPGAIYRCACDRDWTMEWLSDEIETIDGLPGVRLHRQRGPHVREHRAP